MALEICRHPTSSRSKVNCMYLYVQNLIVLVSFGLKQNPMCDYTARGYGLVIVREQFCVP